MRDNGFWGNFWAYCRADAAPLCFAGAAFIVAVHLGMEWSGLLVAFLVYFGVRASRDPIARNVSG